MTHKFVLSWINCVFYDFILFILFSFACIIFLSQGILKNLNCTLWLRVGYRANHHLWCQYNLNIFPNFLQQTGLIYFTITMIIIISVLHLILWSLWTLDSVMELSSFLKDSAPIYFKINAKLILIILMVQFSDYFFDTWFDKVLLLRSSDLYQMQKQRKTS